MRPPLAAGVDNEILETFRLMYPELDRDVVVDVPPRA